MSSEFKSILDLINKGKLTSSDEDPQYSEAFRSAKIREDNARTLMEHQIGLRNCWSYYIMGWITFMIGIEVVIIMGVGLGELKFIQYPYLLQTVIVKTLLEIIALAFIIVKGIYPNRPHSDW